METPDARILAKLLPPFHLVNPAMENGIESVKKISSEAMLHNLSRLSGVHLKKGRQMAVSFVCQNLTARNSIKFAC